MSAAIKATTSPPTMAASTPTLKLNWADETESEQTGDSLPTLSLGGFPPLPTPATTTSTAPTTVKGTSQAQVSGASKLAITATAAANPAANPVANPADAKSKDQTQTNFEVQRQPYAEEWLKHQKYVWIVTSYSKDTEASGVQHELKSIDEGVNMVTDFIQYENFNQFIALMTPDAADNILKRAVPVPTDGKDGKDNGLFKLPSGLTLKKFEVFEKDEVHSQRYHRPNLSARNLFIKTPTGLEEDAAHFDTKSKIAKMLAGLMKPFNDIGLFKPDDYSFKIGTTDEHSPNGKVFINFKACPHDNFTSKSPIHICNMHSLFIAMTMKILSNFCWPTDSGLRVIVAFSAMSSIPQ